MPLKPIAANHGSEKKVYLLKPRGFCAGVVRAIDVVKIALDLYGPPVYVRKEIVHNKHVVEELRAAGAIFVEEIDEVPIGGRAIFSAHGVAPEVRREAAARRLEVIDATCPLVTKVHLEAVRFARDGYSIVLIGHSHHDEVIGTLGEAPDPATWWKPSRMWTRCNCPIPRAYVISHRPRSAWMKRATSSYVSSNVIRS